MQLCTWTWTSNQDRSVCVGGGGLGRVSAHLEGRSLTKHGKVD